MLERIVITGGPGSGKSSIINCLKNMGYACMPEISREIIQKNHAEGKRQPFLENPVSFSKKLLEGRIKQYTEVVQHHPEIVFYDRGIPDIAAYCNYAGIVPPESVQKSCEIYRYNLVFILPPWQEIYTTDGERHENFEQANQVYLNLQQTYTYYGYHCIEVAKCALDERVAFILQESIGKEKP